MPRVKTGPYRRRRHKKTLARTKGYRMTKNRLFRVAHESYLHAMEYSFVGRKKRKRDLRRIWIQRINIALCNISPDFKYSRFIKLASDSNVTLNRKILADIAVKDPKTFQRIANKIFSK